MIPVTSPMSSSSNLKKSASKPGLDLFPIPGIAEPFPVDKLKETFKIIDTDGNHFITSQSLRNALQKADIACTEEEIDEMINMCGNDKTVVLEQFIDFFNNPPTLFQKTSN
jgi:EF-hand domain